MSSSSESTRVFSGRSHVENMMPELAQAAVSAEETMNIDLNGYSAVTLTGFDLLAGAARERLDDAGKPNLPIVIINMPAEPGHDYHLISEKFHHRRIKADNDHWQLFDITDQRD